MHSVGTLPLHMYQKDIPIREAKQFKDLESEVAGEPQESEYYLLIPFTMSFNGNLAKSLAQGRSVFLLQTVKFPFHLIFLYKYITYMP